jgi:hypothetical protein
MVLLSWSVLALASASAPPFVYSDQALQLKALQQFMHRQSWSPNHVTTADPADLSRDKQEWIIWWPPSTQLVVWPLAAAGLSLGGAVRAVALLAVLIGSLGWSRWWQLFELPRRFVIAAAILMPWLRYSSNAVFQYSADVLAFAAVPWALVGVHRIVADAQPNERTCARRACSVGFMLGALYVVKYAAVFVTAGACVALLDAWRHGRRVSLRTAITVLAMCVLPIAALSLFNRVWGGAANMLMAFNEWRLTPSMFVYLIGNPALMAGDAGSLLSFVLTNPAHGLWKDPLVVAALGVPGGIVMAWLLTRPTTIAERMSAIILAVSAVAMLMAWTLSTAVSVEARHVAGASLACTPAVVAGGLRRWRTAAAGVRTALAATALGYLVIPWGVYGPASAIAKSARASGFRTSSTRLHNPLVSDTDVSEAMAAIRGAASVTPTCVWYVPDPLTALEIQERVVIAHADFEPIDWLRAARYRGRIDVCALLPPRFESNGKGEVIRRSFVDVSAWMHLPLAASNFDLWLGKPTAGS